MNVLKSINPIAALVLVLAIGVQLAALKFVPEQKDSIAILSTVVVSLANSVLNKKEGEVQKPEGE